MWSIIDVVDRSSNEKTLFRGGFLTSWPRTVATWLDPPSSATNPPSQHRHCQGIEKSKLNEMLVERRFEVNFQWSDGTCIAIEDEMSFGGSHKIFVILEVS